MKFHSTLNKKLFNLETNTLKTEVSDKLKEIADAFIDYLNINKNAIKDVVLTGSMVSYNYTRFSDIDLHLKVNYDEVHEDCPIVEGYLWEAKAAFNKNHDIHIYGIPVEVYAESLEADTVHNGLYSLWQGKWIDFPEKIEPTDNDAAVEAKYKEYKEMADHLDDSEVAEALLNKIYAMRKSGLAEVGEFSTENLAFKKLRDNGVLDRLKEMKKANIDQQLSLEETLVEFPFELYLYKRNEAPKHGLDDDYTLVEDKKFKTKEEMDAYYEQVKDSYDAYEKRIRTEDGRLGYLEDVNTLCDKIDTVNKDLQSLIQTMSESQSLEENLLESLNAVIDEALAE